MTFTVRPAGPSNVHRESSKASPYSETEAVPRKRISTAIGYRSLLVLADFRLPTLLAVLQSRRLTVKCFETSRGPLDTGGRVRVQHQLDMADARAGVAGQVCRELLWLARLETRFLFARPAGRGG